MRVVVDFDTCESHGKCAEVADQVFEVRDDMLFLLDERPPEALWEKVREAARLCPTEAIYLVEEE